MCVLQIARRVSSAQQYSFPALLRGRNIEREFEAEFLHNLSSPPIHQASIHRSHPMPLFPTSSFFLDRFSFLLLGAMNEFDPKRQPLLPSKSLPLARYALGATLVLDIGAILAVGCWLLALSPSLPDPSMAYNESIIIILSGFCLSFAFAFYLGSSHRHGPLNTLTASYSFGDVWLLAAALLTIAAGFVLIFLHQGFRDGERVFVGGVYQILLHSAGIIILGLPGYSDTVSYKREFPSAVLLGFWIVLALCFGVIQIACADYKASLVRGGW